MRNRLTIAVLLIVVCGSAQTVAICPGISYGGFYLGQKEEGHLVADYKSQLGYTIRAETKDIALDTMISIGFAINYQNYGGYFFTQNGGLGGTYTDEGKITKDVLGLEFYPINLRLVKKIRISLGVSLNALLNYNMSGNHSWSIIGTSPSDPSNTGSTDLNEIDGLIKPYYWGVNSTIGYEFELGQFRIEPQYNFYLGLSAEFDHLQATTKSLRQAIQLSIGYSIK